MKTSFPIDGIVLDRDGSANLHRQLYSQLRGLIERRVLPSGTALPSTRVLARDLGVGRNTVIAAYDQLALEGYLDIRPRTPPLVMDLPTTTVAAEKASIEGRQPSRRAARSCWRSPIIMASPACLPFIPACRIPTISPSTPGRSLLARGRSSPIRSVRHLSRQRLSAAVRGDRALPHGVARGDLRAEQIVITNGAQSAFDLLARILIDDGDTVWLEEPGYYGAGSAFLSAGASLARCMSATTAGISSRRPPFPA